MGERKFQVGQRVWLFDVNRRRYTDPPPGRIYGTLIYSSHFAEHQVYGVEGRSYVIGLPESRGGGCKERYGFAKAEKVFLTDAEKDDAVWGKEHRHRLVDLLRDADPATLRKVAELLGYKPVA